jgi:hypothetical protein
MKRILTAILTILLVPVMHHPKASSRSISPPDSILPMRSRSPTSTSIGPGSTEPAAP